MSKIDNNTRVCLFTENYLNCYIIENEALDCLVKVYLNKKVLPVFVFFSCLLFMVSGLAAQEYVHYTGLQLKSQHIKNISASVTSDDGSIIIAGSFEGVLDINSTLYTAANRKSLFISSFDSTAGLNWIKLLSSPGNSAITGILAQGDNEYIVIGNYFNSLMLDDRKLETGAGSNVFILSFNNKGDILLFDNLLAGFPARVDCFSIDTSHNIVLGGGFKGNLKYGELMLESAGKEDVFILTVDSLKNIKNGFSFGGEGNDSPAGIINYKDGFIVCGNFKRDIALADTIISSKGRDDIFLISFSPGIRPVELFTTGGPASDKASGLCKDMNGGFFLYGSFGDDMFIDGEQLHSEGKKDIFLLHFIDSLQPREKGSWGGRSDDIPYALAVDEYNNIFLSGAFKNKISFDNHLLESSSRFFNGFIVSLSSAMDVNWAKCLPGSSEVLPEGILSDGGEYLYSWGSFHGGLMAEGAAYYSRHAPDIFMLGFRDPCYNFGPDLPDLFYLCNGREDTITINGDYSSYLWGDSLSVDSSLVVADTGLYYVRLSNDYGCTSTDSVKVKNDSLSLNYIVEDELMPEGNNGSIELIVSEGIPPYTYLWFDGSGQSSLYGLQGGLYELIVTDSGGCSIKEKIEVLTGTASGIFDLSVFPNPVSDNARLSYSVPLNTWVEISLYDIAGRKRMLLFEGESNKGTYVLELNATGLEDGIYYIRIQTGEGSISRKIVVSNE